MAFDYTNTQTTITAAINYLGVAVQIQKQDGSNCSTTAVFTEEKRAPETISSLSGMGTLVVAKLVAYIPGNIKTVPLPGDNLVGRGRAHNITMVQPYKPSGTIVAYKLELE